MPDPKRETVSASQAAALLGCSPYLTRWMLWRHFAKGDDIEAEDNERMFWGRALEPAVLSATAERLNLEVRPNVAGEYRRHERLPLGATVDADIFDPNRGPGIVEVKCVDWRAWRDGWTETDAPDHIEAQLQAQMMVCGASWGVIACLVGGNELRFYQREPDPGFAETMAAAAVAFMASLAGPEPSPMGDEMELPLWRRSRQYEPVPEPVDLTESEAADEAYRQWVFWSGRAKEAAKHERQWKARLEILAGAAAELRTWSGTVFLSRSTVPARTQEVKEHIRVTMKPKPYDRGGARPAWDGEEVNFMEAG